MLIANILGVFLFLYIYWKRLKEDYSFERIFNAGFILIGSIIVGSLVSKYLLFEYWFWVLFLIMILAQIFIIFKIKFNFFESFEALVISTLPWLSLVYLSDSITHLSLSSFLVFWFSLMLIFLFYFIDNFYRTFTWYKSGRVGFSGLAALGLFFIVRIFLVTPSFERILSGTVAFLSFLLLFSLSRKND